MNRIISVIGSAILGFGSVLPATAQTAWPRITQVTPVGAQRGTTVELTLLGLNIGLGTELIFEGTGFTVEELKAEKLAPPPPKEGEKPASAPKNLQGKLVARVRIAPDAEPGIRAMRVLTPIGPSDVASFVVGQWPEVAEQEPNNKPEGAQAVAFPVCVTGRIDPAEDVDCFRFHARAGQTLVFDVLAARVGWPLDSILSLQDDTGREIAMNEDFNGLDSLLAVSIPATGDYCLVLRDLRYQGSGKHTYRLTMGEIPYVTAVFPPGGRPGASFDAQLEGYNLGAATTCRLTLPPEPSPDPYPMTVALPNGLSNPIDLTASDTEEAVEAEPNDDPARAQTLPVPGTVNGRILAPSSELRAPSGGPSPQPGARSPEPGAASGTSRDVDCYRFHAEKGQKLVLEVMAQRAGSPLDSTLSVSDAKGQELAANDDGDGKDSRLEFTAPGTGEYVARVTDLHGRQGPCYTYRLTIRPVTPDFHLSVTPDRLAVGRGGRIPVTVAAKRLYGFDGEIALEIAGLPAGVSLVGPANSHAGGQRGWGAGEAGGGLPPFLIRAGQKEANLVLTASPEAAIQASAFRVIGSATIDGKEDGGRPPPLRGTPPPSTPSRRTVRRVAQGIEEIVRNGENDTRPGKLLTAAATEPPDMVVTATPDRLTLSPGGSVEIAVKVQRAEGFKEKVPLVVLGLPAGVTAEAPTLDADQTEAKITLKAEEKAAPGEVDLVVTGRTVLDGQRQVPHAAMPITLSISKQ